MEIPQVYFTLDPKIQTLNLETYKNYLRRVGSSDKYRISREVSEKYYRLGFDIAKLSLEKGSSPEYTPDENYFYVKTNIRHACVQSFAKCDYILISSDYTEEKERLKKCEASFWEGVDAFFKNKL